MRQLLFLGALLIAPSPTPAYAQPPLTQTVANERIDRVEQWLVAASLHEPGGMDEAALAVALWANADLRTFWIDLSNLMALMHNPRASRFEARGEHDRYATKIDYKPLQLARMKLLACTAAGILHDNPDCARISNESINPDLTALFRRAAESRLRGDPNYVLKIGALMHADIAMAGPLASEAIDTRPSLGPQTYLLRVSDGQQTDLGQVAIHWELGRLLLDDVRPANVDKPAPASDTMVLQWYLATAAWMEKKEHLNKAHINRGRELFPRDPGILFLVGCLHETFAGAPVQTAIQAAVMPTGVVLDTEDERAELRQAEEALRRAVDARPAFPEAHLHLGRVLGLRGRAADADVELRAALAALPPGDQPLRYYGELFLGAADAALGRYDDARGAYERAAAMYPMSQSPLLGLSELARRRGDRRSALAFMQKVFELPHDEQDRFDPWWTYHVEQARNADSLLEDLWRPFRQPRTQR